jgi:hypothetical protein
MKCDDVLLTANLKQDWSGGVRLLTRSRDCWNQDAGLSIWQSVNLAAECLGLGKLVS